MVCCFFHNLLSVHCPNNSSLNLFDFVTLSWGQNNHGGLGQGDTIDRGDDHEEMGDYLFAVSLGSDFYAASVACAGFYSCAVSAEGKLKCWVCRMVN